MLGVLTAQTNVLTWKNSSLLDGLNTTESNLNQGNVKKASFGKVCTVTGLNGQIYAQPLVYYSLVFVVTSADMLYLIDGFGCAVDFKKLLIPADERPVPCAAVNACGTYNSEIGIVGTPAIDLRGRSFYVVTFSMSTASACQTNPAPSCFVHRLHVLSFLDLLEGTFIEKDHGPKVIASGTFTSYNHIQTTGLLAVPVQGTAYGPPTVYFGFSSTDGSSGWIFSSYSGSTSDGGWPTTPNGMGGSVSMHGAALSAASVAGVPNGVGVFATTGNGTFDAASNGTDYGNSLVQLGAIPYGYGYFTPYNQACAAVLGSSGVMLIPTSGPSLYHGVEFGSATYGVTGGLDGNLYVVNLSSPGGYTGPSDGSCPGAPYSNSNQQTIAASYNPFNSTPAYWNGNIFAVADDSPLQKYAVSTDCSPGPVCPTPVGSTSFNFGVGSEPVISANYTPTYQSGSAIVWLMKGTGSTPAVLYAFDAEHVVSGKIPELWNSNQCPTRDGAGKPSPFTVPTVAGGQVYVGTAQQGTTGKSQLDEYGLTSAVCN